MLVGLVSDTHGLIRPELLEALAGVELILHAGDVGGTSVLRELGRIAPVHAVYGNTDPPGDPELKATLAIELEGVSIHVSHGHELGSPTVEKLRGRYRADVIVFGHTHKPLVERFGTQWVVNPGAAGPRRFDLKPSIARLTIGARGADVEIIWL
jgi:uncharacterized protein